MSFGDTIATISSTVAAATTMISAIRVCQSTAQKIYAHVGTQRRFALAPRLTAFALRATLTCA
jgi:hypothetical protein